MMKKIWVFLLTGTIMLGAAAQNVGYRGRHFIINAECSLSPSWLRPNPMTEILNRTQMSESAKRYLGLNYLLSPNIEAIVWKNGSVGAGYLYYNSPFDGKMECDGVNFVSRCSFEGMMTAHGFNLYYKHYLKNTYAPLGYFFKFELDGLFINYTCQGNSNFNAFYGRYAVGKDVQFGLRVESGYDFLFFDRLRISMGVSIGSTFGGYRLIGDHVFEEFYEKPNFYGADGVRCHARNRLLNAYWFGVNLGVGLLTF